MSNKIAAVVTKLVSALETLESPEERQRAIQPALAVFGDAAAMASPTLSGGGAAQNLKHADGVSVEIQPNGLAWMKRNSLGMPEIEQFFHIDDDGVSLLRAVGKGKREQTINTYLLTGVSALLKTGKAEFPDEMARSNCENLGCYDVNNHGKTLERFGTSLTGSKKAGWKETVPGQTRAAALLSSAMS